MEMIPSLKPWIALLTGLAYGIVFGGWIALGLVGW